MNLFAKAVLGRAVVFGIGLVSRTRSYYLAGIIPLRTRSPHAGNFLGMTSGGAFFRSVFTIPLLVLGISACSHAASSGEQAPAAVNLPSPEPGQAKWKAPSAAYLAERNLCIDRELARRDLNEFGDARGTTYTQGAPEGVTTTLDRYNYVLRHQPDIAITCTRAPAEPEP